VEKEERKKESLLTFLLWLRVTGRTVGLILTLDDSFDVDYAKEVPRLAAKARKSFMAKLPQKWKKISLLHRPENVE
jgi:hypothetical protein